MASGIRTQVGSNTAKRRALEALALFPDVWLPVEDWARIAAISPTRRMYTYALRLLRYDLVLRGSFRGRLVYRITQEGLKRLAWLRRHDAK
jgi:hypothetical protein